MAESVSHFAVKSIGMSRVNGRKPCTLLEAARHNLREIQAEQGAAGHIDPRRSYLNRVMAGPSTAAAVQAMAFDLMAAAGVVVAKLRRDHSQAIEAVFSLPSGSAIEPGRYFAGALDWLKDALPLPVLSAVVHHDESAVHLHVLLLPLMNGKHVGSSPIERTPLKRLREGFFSQVAGPAGLQRQAAKLRGTVKQWAMAAVMRECERQGLPEKSGRLWSVFSAAMERNPLDALQALGIDLDSIRPPDEQSQGNPIGIAPNPIGFENGAANHRTLSCVGFAERSPTKEPQQAVGALDELWALVGCKVRAMPLGDDRLKVAGLAQQRAKERHSSRSRPAPSLPTIRPCDDGLVRVRDEYAHDLDAWSDL